MYKDVSFSVKELDAKEGIVTVAIAQYNEKDSDGDIILPSAHLKSINEIGPKSSKPRFKHLKKTIIVSKTPGKAFELFVEGEFLIMRSKLSKSTLGRDTLIEYEEGIITEHSHGFKVLTDEFSPNDNAQYHQRGDSNGRVYSKCLGSKF